MLSMAVLWCQLVVSVPFILTVAIANIRLPIIKMKTHNLSRVAINVS